MTRSMILRTETMWLACSFILKLGPAKCVDLGLGLKVNPLRPTIDQQNDLGCSRAIVLIHSLISVLWGTHVGRLPWLQTSLASFCVVVPFCGEEMNCFSKANVTYPSKRSWSACSIRFTSLPRLHVNCFNTTETSNNPGEWNMIKWCEALIEPAFRVWPRGIFNKNPRRLWEFPACMLHLPTASRFFWSVISDRRSHQLEFWVFLDLFDPLSSFGTTRLWLASQTMSYPFCTYS